MGSELEKINCLRETISSHIIGCGEVLENILICLFSGGHILLEGPPGQGKTELAKTLSKCMDMKFTRIQATDDLTVKDIVGDADHETQKNGPLYANIVLVDEINRAPPKTQSAFLEAMAEKKVTQDGVTHSLPNPFMMLATQNQIERDGTYRLPQAQLDRFLLKTHLSYPKRVDERRILQKGGEFKPVQLFKQNDVLYIQELIDRDVTICDDLTEHILDIVSATRNRVEVVAGASTRCAIDYKRAAKARAYLNGRDHVDAADITAMSHPLLSHRIVMNQDSKNFGFTTDDLIDDILRKI